MGHFKGNYRAFINALLDGTIVALRLHDALGIFEEDDVIPIGGVYLSMVDTDPGLSQLEGGLGYGVWARTAHGRCLVGVDESDPDWDSGGEESGSKTSTPTGLVDEPVFFGEPLPPHTHELPLSKAAGGMGQVKLLDPTVFGSGTSRTPISISAAPAANTVPAPVALAEARSAGIPSGIVSAPEFTGDPMLVVQPSFAVFVFTRTG